MSQPEARRLLVGVLLLGIFSGAAINNIAAAPLSLVAEDFRTEPERITLIASASGLLLACCMPVAGWLSVRWGSRRTLILAFALLALGCLLAGLSTSVAMLTVARAIQGVAMSVVPPTVMFALPAIAGPGRREQALGWWAVANGAGTAAGAPLGAFIADIFGWRLMFIVFVPVCLALALGCLQLRSDAEQQGHLDVPGAMLVTAALIFLIAPAMSAGTGVAGTLLLGAVAVGVVFAALFWRRVRTVQLPLVAPELLRSRGFWIGTFSGSSQMFTLGSISVLVPLVLVSQGVALRVAGGFVLMVTFVMMLSAPIVARLARRYGPSVLIVIGLWLATGCIILAARAVSDQGPSPVAVTALLLLGVALGCLQSPSAIVVSAEKSSRGSGMGLFNSIRFAAAVLGISWLSLAAGIGHSADSALWAAAVPVAAASAVVSVTLGIGRPARTQ